MFYRSASIIHIGKLQHDITDDKEVQDFPFIHSTVDSDRCCLEASDIMVYCAAFDCNANSCKNKVISISISSLRSQI